MSADYCNKCSFQEGIVPHVVGSNDPFDTSFGALVPRFSAGISFFSSALIIYVILRSAAKLTTIYHRIMFGMAVADIMSSAAIALTSLPMPKSMPYEKDFGYHWDGTRLGNTSTCNAQGLFFTIGTFSMFSYNGALCVYYACAIGFLMRERNIRKYAEPFLHGFPIIIGLTSGIIPLFYEMYNPSGLVAFCSAVSYPYSCNREDSCNVRGSKSYHDKFSASLVTVTITLMTIIIICFGFVIYRAIQIDRRMSSLKGFDKRSQGDIDEDDYDNNSDSVVMANAENTSNNDQSEIVGNVLNRRHHMKIIIKQALGYICALLLTLIFPVLRLSNTMSELEVLFDKLGLIFMPLQGFFNFIIFTSHKIYNYRRVNRDVSICRVLQKLFRSSFQEPVFISRITIVQKHIDSDVIEEDDHDIAENDGRRFLEVVLDDESGERSSYFLSIGGNSDNKSHDNDDEYHVDVLSYPSKFSRDISAGDDVFVDNSESEDDLSGFDVDDFKISQ